MDAAGARSAERVATNCCNKPYTGRTAPDERRRVTKAMRVKRTEKKGEQRIERRIVMKKIYGVVTLAAVLIGATLLLQRTVKVAAATPTGTKNVVLVHGAFADGSGWEAVAKILEKDGYTVSVAQ